jgi:hypothetical protein
MLSRLMLFGLLVAPARSSTTGPAAPAVAPDHDLTRIERPAVVHGVDPQNTWHSPEAARDEAVFQALEAFHDGDTGASRCRVGGRCGVDLVGLACDRKTLTCDAATWTEAGAPGTTMSVRGADARRVIDALEELDRLPALHAAPRCDGDGCRLAAISCYRDRHDEDGFGGADFANGAIATCDDSRR